MHRVTRLQATPRSRRRPGLVPWAKAGLIIKDGTTPGSSYAAVMVTGGHGVRMQYDFTHDIAGRPASARSPHWLRLSRAGATLTGYESADGAHWTRVGSARLPGLPSTVRAGLFTTSPQYTELTKEGFGGGRGRRWPHQGDGHLRPPRADGQLVRRHVDGADHRRQPAAERRVPAVGRPVHPDRFR